MKITVTNNDINRGYRHSCSNCPVALAMRRAFNRSILVAGIYWEFSGETEHHAMPLTVREWIRAFDDGGLVEPFEFDV